MNPYDIIYNEKLGELLKDVQYVGAAVNMPTFCYFVINALPHHTEKSLDCSIDEYMKVYSAAKTGGAWFMPEMYIALLAVSSLAPKDSLLGTADCLDLEMWVWRKKDWEDMATLWQTIAAPYEKEAKEFAINKAKRDQRELQSKAKIYDLSGKVHGKK